MKIILLTLLLVFFESLGVRAQNLDSDGDGLSNDIENILFKPEEDLIHFNPLISDLPQINFNFSGIVKIGIKVQIEGIDEEGTVIRAESSQEKGEETRDKHFTSRTITQKVSAELTSKSSATVGIGLASSLSSNLSLELKSSAENLFSKGVTYSNEQWNKWVKDFTEINNKVKTLTKSFGHNAGYISTSINIYNPTHHNLTISSLQFSILEVDRDTGKAYDGIPFGDHLQTVRFDDNENLATATRKVIAPGSSSYKIHIPNVNTNRIIEILSRGNTFAFRLEPIYEVEYKFNRSDIANSPKILKLSERGDEINAKTFTIRIIDENIDKAYRISKIRPDGTYQTLKDAIHAIYPTASFGKTIDKEDNEIEYILDLASNKSNLNILKPINDFNLNDLKSGYWFISYNKLESNYRGGLNQEIKPIGIYVTLVYLKGKDFVKQSESKTFTKAFEQKYEFLENTAEVIDYNPLEGDSISIKLSPFIETFINGVKEQEITYHCGGGNSITIQLLNQVVASEFSVFYKIGDKFGLTFQKPDNTSLKKCVFNFSQLTFTGFDPSSNTYSYFYKIKPGQFGQTDKIIIHYNQSLFNLPVEVSEGIYSYKLTSVGDFCWQSYSEQIRLQIQDAMNANQLRTLLIRRKTKTFIALQVFRKL